MAARHSTVARYRILEEYIVGNVTLIRVVMICLGTDKDERYKGILRFWAY